MSEQPLKGVICVLTDPKGYVWGVGHDFEDSAPAGIDAKRACEMRAERRAHMEFARGAFATPTLDGFEAYDIERVVRRLEHKGWKMTTRFIGFDAE